MQFTEDFSYISARRKELIQNGFGKLTVYSVHIDRLVSETEKQNNLNLSETLTRKEWAKHCDEVWRKWSEAGYKLMDDINAKYEVYQYKSDVEYGEHQLFFWSSRGWGGTDYMTTFSLTFNENKGVEYNMELLNNLKLFFSDYPDNFICRIQYDAVIDSVSLETYVKSNIDGIKGKMIEYGLYQGRVKWVDCNNEYGFFRKGARKYYTRLSNIDLYEIIKTA